MGERDSLGFPPRAEGPNPQGNLRSTDLIPNASPPENECSKGRTEQG
jgi:hypothetical protein